MQTNNIQLSLAVKSPASSSSSPMAAGALSSSGEPAGFDRWMQELANRPAQFDRSESKSLPPQGRELPASESGSADQSESSSTGVQKPETSSSDQVQVEKGAGPDSSRSSSSSGESAQAQPSITQEDGYTYEDGSADEFQSVQTDTTSTSSGGVPDADAQVVAADAVAAALDNSAVSAEQTDGEAITDVELPVTDVESDEQTIGISELGQAQKLTSSDADAVGASAGSLEDAAKVGPAGEFADTELVSSEKNLGLQQAALSSSRPDATPISETASDLQQGTRVSLSQRSADDSQQLNQQSTGNFFETPPPGVERASTQGIENGRPFESFRSAAGLPDGDSQTATAVEVGTSVEPALTQNTATNGEKLIIENDAATEITAVMADTEVSVASASNASTDVEVASLTVDQESLPQPVEYNRVDVVGTVSAPNNSEKPVSSNAGVGIPSTSSVATSTVRAEQGAVTQPANSSAQQSGTEGQSNRQAFSEQMAQMGSADKAGEKGSEGRSQAGASDNQTSLPKTASPTTAVADTAGRTALTQPQASVATAVPPQALNRMQQGQWGQKLGERTLMMVQHGPRVAFVQLDPPELGALQVRVHLHQGDQVSLNFSAPNAAVKEAIEQHLPRLREMFAEQGLNLSQSDVRDQSAGRQDRDDPDDGGRRGQYAGSIEESDMQFTEVSVPVGAVDYYA